MPSSVWLGSIGRSAVSDSPDSSIPRGPWHTGAVGSPEIGAGLVILEDDPHAEDVRALLHTHLAFSRTVTPLEHSFALDSDGLADPSVTFFSARRDGELLAIGALKHHDVDLAEVKSMHTREASRGGGVGRAMIEHLLAVARTRGYRTVGLETGTTEDFAAARALYAKAGFEPCGAFGDYEPSAYNTFMNQSLD